MSSERTSSAVRNLRSLFENKESEVSTPERKDRSVSREGAREGRRPLSKVRSSFVIVEQHAKMARTQDGSVDEMGELTRQSSASLRRESFSENGEDHHHLAALKKVVSQECERREKDSTVHETIPESAIEATPIGTPTVEMGEVQLFNGTKQSGSKLSTATTANPDKPTTSADEEEVGSLKPADPTDAGAVSAGQALDSSAGNITPHTNGTTKKNGASSKPNAISTKKASASSAPKSPITTKPAPTRELNRKVSRSSLTAPTAASNARAAEAKREPMPASLPKAKARETTKPLSVSSHLLAPTAASKARQAQETTSKPFDGRASTSSVRGPPKVNSTRPTPRTSLAAAPRPESRTSQFVSRGPTPSNGSFLDRMMRPTAASQNRTQEKYEAKPAPRKPLPVYKKPTASKGNDISKPVDSGPAAPVEEDSIILDLSEDTPVKSATTTPLDDEAVGGADAIQEEGISST